VVIQLPSYFDALNKDPRYQFIALYQPMPNLYIRRKSTITVSSSAVGTPKGQVSWQITAIRHDAFILAHPIIVEVLKGPGQPVNRGDCLFEPLCR
jgi:hypothetical protein